MPCDFARRIQSQNNIAGRPGDRAYTTHWSSKSFPQKLLKQIRDYLAFPDNQEHNTHSLDVESGSRPYICVSEPVQPFIIRSHKHRHWIPFSQRARKSTRRSAMSTIQSDRNAPSYNKYFVMPLYHSEMKCIQKPMYLT